MEERTPIEQAISRQRVKGQRFMSPKRAEKIRDLEQRATQDARNRTAAQRHTRRARETAKGRTPNS